MTTHRVPAPTFAAGEKPKGPASYFPSIEATYGRPMQHWLDLAAEALGNGSHSQAVALLKDAHGLGHGHANAVVAYAKAHLNG
jgi:hypothetical protein